jgi:hypothetical protein
MPLRSVRFLAALMALAASGSVPVSAGQILLQWDPVPGATGYRVYYDTRSGSYRRSLDVGNSTRATVPSLTDCTPWYLAVKAYNSAGESAEYSNEVVGWPRPEVTAPDPAAEIQGARFTLDIRGSNFQSGARVEIDSPHVFVDSAAVRSCAQIQVAASIEPTSAGVRPAEIGRYKITIVNPDDVFGERSQAFEVRVNPARFDLDRRDGPSKGRLDGRDAIWLSHLFASREGDNRYQPDSDFDGNGWVDGEDLAYLASNLGKCWDGATWKSAACPESLR